MEVAGHGDGVAANFREEHKGVIAVSRIVIIEAAVVVNNQFAGGQGITA